MTDATERRTARVSESGAGIFLSPDDLRSLGVDPDTADAIEYQVKEGDLRVEHPLVEA